MTNADVVSAAALAQRTNTRKPVRPGNGIEAVRPKTAPSTAERRDHRLPAGRRMLTRSIRPSPPDDGTAQAGRAFARPVRPASPDLKGTNANTTKIIVSAHATTLGIGLFARRHTWFTTRPIPCALPNATYVHAAPCQSPAIAIASNVAMAEDVAVTVRKERTIGVYRYVVMKRDRLMCHQLPKIRDAGRASER